MAAEDANGWERPTSGYDNGTRALRRAAGGRPVWENVKTGALPPVVPYAKRRAEDSAEDVAERRPTQPEPDA